MDLLGAILVIVLFAILLRVVRLVPKTKEVISIGQQALETLRNEALSDAEKERKMQRDSLRLFWLLLALVSGSLFALLAPLALIWLSGFAGLFSVEEVLDMFMRWDVILGGTVLGVVIYVVSVNWLNRSS